MLPPQRVLLLGATGRTGRRVLEQLLGRGMRVRVVVRSAARLPRSLGLAADLTVLEADLLSLSDEDLERQVRDCDAVVSCLGHVISLRGVFGPPRDLVARATARVCRAIEATQPAKPIRFILMTSVSVDHPAHSGPRRAPLERALLSVLRVLVPPVRDNQRAADFLYHSIGADHSFVQWVTLRPDTLLEGDISQYAMHEGQMDTLFAPGSTHMASLAHCICELVADPVLWQSWRGKLPVVVDDASVRVGSCAAAMHADTRAVPARAREPVRGLPAPQGS